MYHYSDFDRDFLAERNAQFRAQVERRIDGSLTEDEFKPLRLKWDKGYGHFTTRQNIQYNWPELRDVPDMLDALGAVNMHAIQTSGNTIRNVTADHFAGAAADEIADPRPIAELIRQWSTDHPEFQFLPRKFKVAVSGAAHDRAVVRAHDIGLRIVERDGKRGFVPTLEAVVSVYNLLGRRDNKFLPHPSSSLRTHASSTRRIKTTRCSARGPIRT